MDPLQIPDQELVSIHRYVELRDTAVTGDGWEELSEVNQHVVPQGLSVLWWLTEGDIRSSCVSELTSALQALEVGVLQDAVDLQVGHQAHTAGQF